MDKQPISTYKINKTKIKSTTVIFFLYNGKLFTNVLKTMAILHYNIYLYLTSLIPVNDLNMHFIWHGH